MIWGSTWAMTVLDLLIDPEEPNIVHLGTPSGVYASDDGGRSWELLSDLAAEELTWGRYSAAAALRIS